MSVKTKIKCPCGQETTLVLSSEGKWLYDESRHGSGADSGLKCFNCQKSLKKDKTVTAAEEKAVKSEAQADLDRIVRDKARLEIEEAAAKAKLQNEQGDSSNEKLDAIKKELGKYTVTDLEEMAEKKEPPLVIPEGSLKQDIIDLMAETIIKE